MISSIGVLLLLGLALGALAKRLRLPPLIGYLLAGMLAGPYGLGLLLPDLLQVSADIRQLALVIILLRAGLTLQLGQLKSLGRPALLLCFVPACFEIFAYFLLAPALAGLTPLSAALMGTVMAAVSPAVVVPAMLRLEKNGYGTEHGIPQLIMAGASLDDIFVIVLFTSLLTMAQTGDVRSTAVLPALGSLVSSIGLGLLLGVLAGLLLGELYRRLTLGSLPRLVLLLGGGLLLLYLEQWLSPWISVSGLLGLVVMGTMVLRRAPLVVEGLSRQLEGLWYVFEILLFSLVGATVDPSFLQQSAVRLLLLLVLALSVRMIGVWVSLLGTSLTTKERLFCMIAYSPKATVQAAIGTIPLSMGLSGGQEIATMAVLGILLTAPLGAIAIQKTEKKLLQPEPTVGQKSSV